VAIHRIRHQGRIEGNGVVIEVPDDLTTTDVWLDYYGLDVADGAVTLFKGVDDEYRSQTALPDGSRATYAPGATVEAPDWHDRPVCGGGLHLSPRPELTRRYTDPTRFVAVSVAVEDLVVIVGGDPPDKVKVRRCTVLHEVDEDGVALAAAAVAS
jgi:hypothetical protein